MNWNRVLDMTIVAGIVVLVLCHSHWIWPALLVALFLLVP